MYQFAMLFILFVGCMSIQVYANINDSPLTSTSFHEAYLDVPMVQKALKAKTIDHEIFDWLIDAKNPLDQRAAVVNALGWDTDGQQNLNSFKALWAKRFGSGYMDFADPEQENNKRPDMTILYAYLMAMDNYFDVQEASILAGYSAQYLQNS